MVTLNYSAHSINMRNNIIKLLEDKSISAAEISRQTGIDTSTIQKYHLGSLKIDRMILNNAEKLYEYAKSKGIKSII